MERRRCGVYIMRALCVWFIVQGLAVLSESIAGRFEKRGDNY